MEATAKIYRAALYMRLSKEDEGSSESSSIATQRKMLRAFASENNFSIYDEYIDDGVSGTTFERPEFLRMKTDIEEGFINIVITKDLSRLGRDYISTGNLTEIYFPSKGVRYIAINDGYDSDSAYTDIAPFRNVINEMYARDTSKKIKSAFQVKMQAGEFISNFAPYGYEKDPKNKNHLVIDDEVAPIVKEMFQLAVQGKSPKEIARTFNDRGILTPSAYRCVKKPYLDLDNYSKRKEWTSSIICKMLRNIVYVGDLAQGKTSKISFKSKITVSKPRENWCVVENTHSPIVTRETFNIVRNRSVSRKNLPKNQFKNIFSGIAKCMDCGRNMSSTGTRKKGALANLTCGGYKLYGKKECTNHFIDYETLYNIVLQEIRKQVYLTKEEKNDIIKVLEDEAKEEANGRYGQSKRKIIQNLKLRQRELDSIISKLYEDNISGKLSSDRLDRMLEAYQKEENQIRTKLDSLLKEDEENKKESFENFFKLVEDITEVKELTRELLLKLVDKIEIGQGTYDEKGRKHQVVRIYYKFIGNVKEK